MLQRREKTKREIGYLWSNIARPFTKTHLLMLAMEGVDKERNRLLRSNIHNTRQFSRTHQLMLAMNDTGKERNRLLLAKHTHIHNATQDDSVKLTD